MCATGFKLGQLKVLFTAAGWQRLAMCRYTGGRPLKPLGLAAGGHMERDQSM